MELLQYTATLMGYTALEQWAVDLLQYTGTLLGSHTAGGSGQWCGVVWCGVVWCAEGAITKWQRPGCLPKGKGKRAGLCVLCARCV